MAVSQQTENQEVSQLYREIMTVKVVLLPLQGKVDLFQQQQLREKNNEIPSLRLLNEDLKDGFQLNI